MARRARRHGRPGTPAATVARPSAQPVATAAGDGELEGLAVTHWFDSGVDGDPYAANVRFRGQRVGGRGKPGSADTFVKDERVAGIVPGSGPVSVTTHVYGLVPGTWTVTAELLPATAASRTHAGARQPRRAAGATLPRASWSWWSWSLGTGEFRGVQTRWGPLARLVSQPAVVPGSWFGLVALGVVVGIFVQALMIGRAGIPVFESVAVTVVASLLGLAAAKVRYITLHPRTWRSSPAEGWAVGGFLVVMPLAALAGIVLLGLPVGAFLDASAPGLFFGVAIGRLGCFLTGCCAGRCTRSRWGIWSSDRRVGARRIPTQLMESAVGLGLGVVTLVVLLVAEPPIDGVVFVSAMVAYFAARTVLLRLRADRQPSS